MAFTVCELIWLQNLLRELKVERKKPVQFYCDSKAALQIAANPIFHERMKHIDIDCHNVKEKTQDGTICTNHIWSSEQPVDLLTKVLRVQQHKHLMGKLNIKDIFSGVNLRGVWKIKLKPDFVLDSYVRYFYMFFSLFVLAAQMYI